MRKSMDILVREYQKTRIGELWGEGDAWLFHCERRAKAKEFRLDNDPVTDNFIRRCAIRMTN
jgi:hypothetical protein